MKRFLSVVIAGFLMTTSIFSQAAEDKYRIYDAKGNPATLEQIIQAAGGSDVIFLGENHDDSVAHALQFQIFKAVVEKYGATRRVGLTMEMFERDAQTVINEYLSGLISENHFLLSSRPWGNYKTDYRPLVELAKEKKLPVVAANAPRRYVNMVSRNGRETLNQLSKEAREWLAPLPFGNASEEYSAKFKALMGGMPAGSQSGEHGLTKILDSQTLWDATMADSVAQFLKKNKGGLAVHLNGSFHTENRLGTVEHLLKYRPKARALVVTMRYEADFNFFDKKRHERLGDFVILTDVKAPRSQR
jgi:uncharacterized iron-regulated protein